MSGFSTKEEKEIARKLLVITENVDYFDDLVEMAQAKRNFLHDYVGPVDWATEKNIIAYAKHNMIR